MFRSSRPDRLGPKARGAIIVLLAGLLVPFPLRAFSPAPGLALYRLDPAVSEVDEQRLLSGEYDRHFVPVAAGELRLPGGSQVHWLRLDFGAVLGEDKLALVLPRVPVEAIELLLPTPAGLRRMRSSFYTPDAFAPALGATLAFPLGEGRKLPAHAYLRVVSAVPVRIAPALVVAEEAVRRDRSAAVVFAAAYTALAVLLLVNLMLFFALREQTYLDVSLWMLAALLWLLARSGHLFNLPLLGLFGWFQAGALAIFDLLISAASIGFLRRYADFGRLGQDIDRLLLLSQFLFLGLAGLGLVLSPWYGGPLLLVADFVLILSFTGLLLLSAGMWRRGDRRGRVASIVLVLLAPIAWVSTVHAASYVPSALRLEFVAPVVFAVAALLFSVALVEGVIELRLETARARAESEQLGASLRREVALRRFRESARAQLLASSAADAEWLAYRRLLAELRGLLPQRALAIYATASDGRELLISDPQNEQASFRDLVREHSEKLRAIGRARSPVEARFERRPAGEPNPQPFSYAIVPLPLSRPAWGVAIAERELGQGFAREELATLQEFAALAVALIGETRTQVELKREADTDVLTGVLNRRAGDAALAAAVKRTTMQRLPLTVAMIDLDHLRAINELHGHAAGDRCLVVAAELIAARLAGDDLIARFGGEEFLAIMPGRTLPQARELFESIRSAIEAAEVEVEGGRIKFTVSIGLAQRQADDSDASLIQRAEAAVVRAKELGRNRVVTAQQGVAPLRPIPGFD